MSEFRSCDSDHFDLLFIFLFSMLEVYCTYCTRYCTAHAASSNPTTQGVTRQCARASRDCADWRDCADCKTATLDWRGSADCRTATLDWRGCKDCTTEK